MTHAKSIRRASASFGVITGGAAVLAGIGCSTGSVPPLGTGGAAGSGGAVAAGGMPSSGGAGPASGGSATGGVVGTGGAGTGGTGSGGAPASGGTASGGTASGGGGGTVDLGPCPTPASLEPGDTTMMLTVDGMERSFLVHVPSSYDGVARVPVVFDFHGLTGTSSQQKGLSGWDDLADAEGLLAVYPQGLGNDSNQPAWNAGLCCGDTADDVAFVRAIVATLTAEACIDPKRIYASGCSNGGGMSYRLACEAADVIAGVAPVDFDCVVGSACGDCDPARPVPVVQFRGTMDTLVDYEGAGAFAGAQANFATWGEINLCTGAAEASSGNAACETYPACGNGVETQLCTVQGGTHCGSYGSFMIPEVAWNVLRNHALP